MQLIQLNAATSVKDLRLPPSNHLEILKHDRLGQFSIRINDRWRICFRSEVDMIDRGLPPIHPCEFLAETLTELHISQADAHGLPAYLPCAYRMW
jgi:hypothetical protein